jgi:hypothetical protein
MHGNFVFVFVSVKSAFPLKTGEKTRNHKTFLRHGHQFGVGAEKLGRLSQKVARNDPVFLENGVKAARKYEKPARKSEKAARKAQESYCETRKRGEFRWVKGVRDIDGQNTEWDKGENKVSG